MKIRVLHSQSLLDISLQHTGTAESVFELALANGLSLTDEISAGTFLSFEEETPTEKEILNYYTAKKIHPATAFSVEDEQVLNQEEGISIWAINLDFQVVSD